MNSIVQRLSMPLLPLLSLDFFILASSTCDAANSTTVLQIQEQGSFAVGGNIVKEPGTFDPQQPANPQGQTLHGDHAYVFYKLDCKKVSYQLIALFFIISIKTQTTSL